MSYIEVTGKTEEEAVRKALTQLGLGGTTCLWKSWACQERLSGHRRFARPYPCDLRHRRAGGKKAEPTKKVEKRSRNPRQR